MMTHDNNNTQTDRVPLASGLHRIISAPRLASLGASRNYLWVNFLFDCKVTFFTQITTSAALVAVNFAGSLNGP